MVTIELEVVALDYHLYARYGLSVLKQKTSVNGHFDILIIGEEEDAKKFVMSEYYGEDEEFFNEHVNRL